MMTQPGHIQVTRDRTYIFTFIFVLFFLVQKKMQPQSTRTLCLWLFLCFAFADTRGEFVTRNSRPNIVLLMADDLGVGDLGCYGNTSVSTPNIDRLASEGVMLTQHLAAASVCSPSRAAFLTGRYPVRSGKWHLGMSCASRGDHCAHPLNHGFDFFYGMPLGLLGDCSAGAWPEVHRRLRIQLWVTSAALATLPFLLLVPRLAGWFPVPWMLMATSGFLAALFFLSWFSSYGFVRRWNCIIMRDHDVIQQPADEARAAGLMLSEALAFIDRHKRSPFLLFLSFLHVHTPLPTRGNFVGRSKFGAYGDNVEELDWMVGKVLAALDRERLTNQTLVYFTSDNGGRLEAEEGGVRAGGWNGVYRGGSGMGGWEGGVRVPGIFRWPTVLEAGRVIEEPTSLMDLLPTLSHVGGGILPQDRVIDGQNLMPLLEGHVQHSDHEFLFHYCGIFLHSVRWHQRDCNTVWKAHYVTPNVSPEGSDSCQGGSVCACSGDVTHHDPPLLFDISRDPAESRPLNPDNEALFETVLSKMSVAMRKHRATITPAPRQLSVFNALWKPWLQPCCGAAFPLCGCTGEDA
ncbi:arylsulfatase H isoform X2 [Alexandromys fortis]|uniref:arylsulfatase H isoform X2 n=1 Tax=Alexandromys fortis TaxID=100897 RepID=UPI00215394D0|nr:arylsulfatase H isoform X2 [Microtus fortis]